MKKPFNHKPISLDEQIEILRNPMELLSPSPWLFEGLIDCFSVIVTMRKSSKEGEFLYDSSIGDWKIRERNIGKIIELSDKSISISIQGKDTGTLVKAFDELIKAKNYEERKLIVEKYCLYSTQKEIDELRKSQNTEEIVTKAVVFSEYGFHMRSSMALVDNANKFESLLFLRVHDSPFLIDAKRIMDISFACLCCGRKVEIIAFGVDAQQAVIALKEQIETKDTSSDWTNY